jgi:hypothetical protein
VLARGNVLAVRRPPGVVEQAKFFLRELPRIAAVGAHDPDVVAAAGVADERDLRAVGREARLHRPAESAVDRPGVAARDRQQIDVAQQVEGDRLPVRADVEAHPGAFPDVDGHRVRLAGRGVHLPLLIGLLVGGQRAKRHAERQQVKIIHLHTTPR